MRDIRTVLRERLKAALEEDRQQHRQTPPNRPVYSVGLHPHEDPVAADIEGIDFLLHDAREALARRDLAGVSEDLDELMETEGFPSDKRVELGLGLLRVQIQVLEQARANLTGGISPAVHVEPSGRPAEEESSANTGDHDVPLFSVAAAAFIRDQLRHESLKQQSASQNETTYRMFAEICGDHPVIQYTRRHVAEFYDVLSALPSLWSKSREWRDLTLREIAEVTEGEDHERMTVKTMKRHFSAIGTLFDALESRGDFDGPNPAHQFKFPNVKRGEKKRKRKPWSSDKLRQLLASPVWTGCYSHRYRSRPGRKVIQDSMYWLPLLALYHGNRLEELAQLRREDICCEDGIHFMNISDEGERQVKNDASIRLVPFHPRVEALGFLDYVGRVAPSPCDRVFPDLKAGGRDRKYGHSFTKRFLHYRKKIGLYEKGCDFHSFRHTCTEWLYKLAEASDAEVDAITGHAGGGMSRGVYFDGKLKLSHLREVMYRVPQLPEDQIARPPS